MILVVYTWFKVIFRLDDVFIKYYGFIQHKIEALHLCLENKKSRRNENQKKESIEMKILEDKMIFLHFDWKGWNQKQWKWKKKVDFVK